jgi:hypothetical protein
MISSKVKSIVPYILVSIVLLYIIKPPIVFKPNGKLREYGLGYDSEGYKQTLYTMHTLIIVLVVFLYLFID